MPEFAYRLLIRINIFCYAQVIKETQVLIYNGNTLVKCPLRILKDYIVTVNDNVSPVRLKITRQNVHKRTFSSPVLTAQRVDFSRVDGNGYVIKCFHTGKLFGDILEKEGSHLKSLHVDKRVCFGGFIRRMYETYRFKIIGSSCFSGCLSR